MDAYSICDVSMFDVNHVGFDQSSDKKNKAKEDNRKRLIAVIDHPIKVG